MATAQKFLSEGWRVVGTYLNTPIPIKDKNLTVVKYDQGDSKSICPSSRADKRNSTSSRCFNQQCGVLLDAKDNFTDPVKVRQTLEVNVVGVIDLTEQLLPLLCKGGHVVNLNSGYGSISAPILDDETAIGYSISKAALNMYTRHLAFRLESEGIVVSALAPGWVKTRYGQHGFATETEGPDRTPEQAADDIFTLVTTIKETGQFWRLGKKTEW